ncbi:BCCT family transporter [Jutongia huaianensis]|uniref:BCCT family transporter n=1 Tax=Jutongia huaianensis TaxID=2763668 RepID=UPI0024B5BF35|nr:BCCT family transporter [Jutongia huaianensis]
MIFVTVGTHEQPFNLLIQKVDNLMSLLWCLLLIVLPIALVFSESSMSNIQSISIIFAFPIGLIMIVMIWSLFKDMKKYIKEK